MKTFNLLLLLLNFFTHSFGQVKLSEQYFFNKCIDLMLTQNDIVGSEGNILMISENNYQDIYNTVVKYGWLKEFEMDTMKFIEIKNNTNIVLQNKVIFIDNYFELKRNEHITTTLLKFGRAHRIFNKKNAGYILPFELYYKEGVDGFGFDNVGAIIGLCDKNGYFYEFIYHDYSEFFIKEYNLKLIDSD